MIRVFHGSNCLNFNSALSQFVIWDPSLMNPSFADPSLDPKRLSRFAYLRLLRSSAYYELAAALALTDVSVR